MPRLLVFAPCEHVLISQGESASLIVILHQLTVIGDLPDPIPPNAASLMKWHIFAQWETTPDEVGVRFEQRVELVDNENHPTPLQTIGEFVPEAGKPIHRMVINLTFLPLLPAEHYRLRLSLRRAGEQAWVQVGDYPMQIIYQRVPAAAAVTATRNGPASA